MDSESVVSFRKSLLSMSSLIKTYLMLFLQVSLFHIYQAYSIIYTSYDASSGVYSEYIKIFRKKCISYGNMSEKL